MKQIATLAAIAALALAPAASFAKNPKHCPPGLAKKTPACVPPGLAKKGVTYQGDNQDDGYDRDDYRVLNIGDVITLDGKEYVVVATDGGTLIRRGDDLFRLPRIGDGSDYVRVGDAILRVDRKTKAVIEMIELADLILN